MRHTEPAIAPLAQARLAHHLDPSAIALNQTIALHRAIAKLYVDKFEIGIAAYEVILHTAILILKHSY